MTESNIINFPSMKKTEDAEFEFATEYSKAVLSNLLDTLRRMGYDIKENEENLLPMSMFVFEAIRAFYLKGSGVEHPMHEIAEELFADLDAE
jgi:hypothetical protein